MPHLMADMVSKFASVALVMSLVPAATLAVEPRRGPQAAHRSEQAEAFSRTREGRIRPLREIEGRVVPRMTGADYLGPEYDPGSSTYRLKFIRGGSVIWIDVDGRTGAIIGRRGN
jgi:hypothetical protein